MSALPAEEESELETALAASRRDLALEAERATEARRWVGLLRDHCEAWELCDNLFNTLAKHTESIDPRFWPPDSAQRRQILTVVDAIDRDGDGLLSRSEWEEYLLSLVLPRCDPHCIVAEQAQSTWDHVSNVVQVVALEADAFFTPDVGSPRLPTAVPQLTAPDSGTAAVEEQGDAELARQLQEQEQRVEQERRDALLAQQYASGEVTTPRPSLLPPPPPQQHQQQQQPPPPPLEQQQQQQQQQLPQRQLDDLAPPQSIEDLVHSQRPYEGRSPHGLEARSTIGHGNCQFASLAAAVYGDQNQHQRVRVEVCDHLQRVRETWPWDQHISTSWWDYLRVMQRPNWIGSQENWGDEITLRAAADRYNLRLFVLYEPLRAGGVRRRVIGPYVPRPAAMAQRSIMLEFSGDLDHGHYVLLGRHRGAPAVCAFSLNFPLEFLRGGGNSGGGRGSGGGAAARDAEIEAQLVARLVAILQPVQKK